MALALTILALVLFTNVLGWIGHAVLLDAVYSLYARIFLGGFIRQQSELKVTIVEVNRELSQTSAQEEFAKWAKLRRRRDKSVQDLEKLNVNIGASKSGFSRRFNFFVWCATTGVQLVLVWWYRREPVFYLPPSWFGPLTWAFSLPSAPSGSVSGAVWQMACQRVIRLGERFATDIIGRLGPSSPSHPSSANISAPLTEKDRDS